MDLHVWEVWGICQPAPNVRTKLGNQSYWIPELSNHIIIPNQFFWATFPALKLSGTGAQLTSGV